MNNITICIPTYRRQLLLEKLIMSIIECNLDESLICDVSIIIVDNDIQRSAVVIVNRLKEKFNNLYKIHYYNYPQKGLSKVRNELIKIALTMDPDYLVFIDDDQYVTSVWLNELVKTVINNNADAARGPVLAISNEPVPHDIWCWFQRERYPNNTKLNTLTTGNMIIKKSSLVKYNLWFDSRFDKTGAEDSFFGVQLLKIGGTIFWADNAITYEIIPRSRAKISWLIKRFYNGANTYTYILKLEKKYFLLLKKTLISFMYIISGLCSIIIILIPIKRRFWSLLKLAEGLGGIAGLISLKYNEYI